MRWRNVVTAAAMVAVPVVAMTASEADAQAALPACPQYSAVAFDWPNGSYTQITGLPLGCFPLVCPVGYDAQSPYSDGRNPLTVIGPYSGNVVQPSPQSLPNGFIPPGCLLRSGSVIPGPTNGTPLSITLPTSVPTQVLETPVISVNPTTATTIATGATTATTAFAGTVSQVGGTNLPRTGGETRPLLQIGGLLLAGGVALVAGSRRRQGYSPKFAAARR